MDRINPATGSYDLLTWVIKLDTTPVSQLTWLATVNPEGTDLGDAAFAVLANKLGKIALAHAAVAAERQALETERLGFQAEQAWNEIRAGL